MILTAAEIASREIVGSPVQKGKRATSYDATVGAIILNGIPVETASFTLPKRGMIWVVSNEEFTLPPDVTGLATLKTGWTHNGLLALNVGIIDPGYHGPLGTAVVNFSDKNFVISKGDPFFRVIFHGHLPSGATADVRSKAEYISEISDKSARSPNSFLDISSLANEVIGQIFTSSRWANRLVSWGLVVAIATLLLGMIAIFAPIAFTVFSDTASDKAEVISLKRELADVKDEQGRDRQAIDALQKKP